MRRSPDNFASVPMIIPLIILLQVEASRSLQLIYLLPVIWSSLLVSSYLDVWLLRNSIKSRTALFLALYMFEGTLVTLVSTLIYLPYLLEKQFPRNHDINRYYACSYICHGPLFENKDWNRTSQWRL